VTVSEFKCAGVSMSMSLSVRVLVHVHVASSMAQVCERSSSPEQIRTHFEDAVFLQGVQPMSGAQILKSRTVQPVIRKRNAGFSI
jgi:hypothetical protein